MNDKRRKIDRLAHDVKRSGEEQVQALVHELQVHTEEITVQNEQLLKAQADLEEARDRYADLFDFSPIGYATLDAHGVIRQINITATALFDKQRSFLVGLPMVTLINHGSRECFRKFLVDVNRAGAGSMLVEVELRSKTKPIVQVIARPLRSRSGEHQLLAAVVDITSQRQLEQARQDAFEREQQRSAELADEIEVRVTAEERIKALHERLVSVQEQERRRLALNLHDHLGQQLTALRLALASARDVTDAGDRASRFELIDQIVSQLDRDVDFLAWELRPAALDDVGLEPAITQFLQQWSQASGVAADFHHAPKAADRLRPEIESNLYRIVQEALNNVSKHAQARHVSVLLEHKGHEVTLIVEDDGRGFEVADDRAALRKGGMGLAGIRERTALIGGEVELESAPGEGTTLFIRIPLVEAPATESA